VSAPRLGERATDQLSDIYARRFTDEDSPQKAAIWREITGFLQRYVDSTATVVDLACDRGDFINAIRAGRRIAVDLRDVREHLDPGVEFIQADGLSLADNLAGASVDVVFMSNYLEHLPSAEAVVEQLKAVATVLRPGGRAIILQPNIRLTGGAYWDVLDHKTPLTEKSLTEAVGMADLDVEDLIIRFLPYTTKSRFPQNRWLVRAYLHFRPAWWLLGRQTLLVARRPAAR
jgi:SAM-dependent methyltransferase